MLYNSVYISGKPKGVFSSQVMLAQQKESENYFAVKCLKKVRLGGAR